MHYRSRPIPGRPSRSSPVTDPTPPAAPATGARTVRVMEDRDGQRIDNFLMGYLKGVPRSLVYKLLRSGQVRVNGGRIKAERRLEAGDEVRIPPIRVPDPEEKGTPPQGFMDALDAAIVFEDARLLALNKPSGVASHGGSGISFGAIETLRALRPKETLELVHRLDRDTSGLIMVARKRSFLRRLQKLMQGGGMEKRYWLLCQGFKGQSRSIDAPLLKLTSGNNERIVRVSREGKPSDTEFRLLERLADTQLVEATLGTGRTHQIRVHAQYGGFPLLGDSKYGSPTVTDRLKQLGIQRLCLHARTLKLRHPETGAQLSLEAPLDDAFEHAIKVLKQEKVG